MTNKEITELIILLKRTDISAWLDRDEHGFTTEKTKRRLGALSVKYLKALAKALAFASTDYEVKYNPGGPAVAGDTWLQSTSVAVLLSSGNTHGVLYRRCARVEIPGRGGKPCYRWSTRYPNHWGSFDTLSDLPTTLHLIGTCANDGEWG